MKNCSCCGNSIDENAIFCPYCGARANGDGPRVNYEPYGGGFSMFGGYNYQQFVDNQPSKAVAILSFIFLYLGLIIWFTCRRSRPGKARSAIKGMLSSACVSIPLIGAALWIIWKDDYTKRDLAKVGGISAIVGAGIYGLMMIASIILTLTGALDSGFYISIPGMAATVSGLFAF